MHRNQVEPLGITDGIVRDALFGMITGEWRKKDTALESVERVQTFEQAGVASHDKGLVVTLPDGTEFQLTVV